MVFRTLASKTLPESASLLRDFFQAHKKVLAITGAGVSTESGIPDYRSPVTGSYSKGHKPVLHSEFMNKEMARKRYWFRSVLGWRLFTGAKPNRTHFALAKLENELGLIQGVVTQNVDRLHQKAGSSLVIDLHGNNELVECMSCHHIYGRNTFQRQLEEMNPEVTARLLHHLQSSSSSSSSSRADGDFSIEPTPDMLEELALPCCPKCDSQLIKPRVVFFGDSVPTSRQDLLAPLLEESDGLLIMGTTISTFSVFKYLLRWGEGHYGHLKSHKNIFITNHMPTRFCNRFCEEGACSSFHCTKNPEESCGELLERTLMLLES